MCACMEELMLYFDGAKSLWVLSSLLAGRVNGGWVEHCNTIRQSHLSHGIITQMTSNTMQLKQRVPSKNMGEDGLNLVGTDFVKRNKSCGVNNFYSHAIMTLLTDWSQQYAPVCTRVEAHLALLMFRPHSILKGGIKTQTQLYLMVVNLFSLLRNLFYLSWL